ncbi:hypothetical protein BKA70DRAFT_1265768 [Coprinopsis sp. MPI-PUGE-AT-0042]|nr:hypothetical protein BKA70DRAFT_1265768 [Coprinopsis sp. MPI-PUGE-AT-0042]
MNNPNNQDIPWNQVADSSAASSPFPLSDVNFDNGSGWYPSPGAEEPFGRYSHPSRALDADMDHLPFAGTTAPPASPIYLMPSATTSSSPSPGQGIGEQATTLSISTTFYPENGGIPVADMVLSSNDSTLFYLNSHLLASSGFNVFSVSLQTFSLLHRFGTLPGGPLLHGPVSKLPDSSATLDIIFYTLYGLSCDDRAPSFESLVYAIGRMPDYNLAPSTFIQHGTPLYAHLMDRHAPLQPLRLYVLAGQHSIEPLAVGVSSHLLGLDLSEITDEMAATMTSVYLKRLFFMHKGRLARLKTVLARPPSLHDSKVAKVCDIATRSAVRSKWTTLVTSLVWDATPDISPHSIQAHLRSTGEALPCTQCQHSWKERSVEAATEWATVKFTI